MANWDRPVVDFADTACADIINFATDETSTLGDWLFDNGLDNWVKQADPKSKSWTENKIPSSFAAERLNCNWNEPENRIDGGYSGSVDPRLAVCSTDLI